jgi:hypothetical protein
MSFACLSAAVSLQPAATQIADDNSNALLSFNMAISF